MVDGGKTFPDVFRMKTLTTYHGGKSIAAGKMKEAGYAHWASPNTGTTNSIGFTALPGGHPLP
jgi:hypothetical protein